MLICQVFSEKNYKFLGMFQKPRLSNAVSHRVFPTTEGHTHPVTCRTTGVYLKHAHKGQQIDKKALIWLKVSLPLW